MIERVVDTIGLMDPRGYSFGASLEKLFSHLDLQVRYEGQLHRVVTRRLRSRPYDVLRAVSPYTTILNLGDRRDLHFNSYLLTVAPTTYLINDLVSALAMDKNATYGHMTRLGFHIPSTAALPAPGASDAGNEMVDLREIGEEIGFPAYLKPQVGDQWGEAHRVEDVAQLEAAYRAATPQPMNLQRAINYGEFAHVIGVGPMSIPIHCNPGAPPEKRFVRSPERAVQHDFLGPEALDEVAVITRVCNAFFNWDFNACDVLVDEQGVSYPIDFANVGPDCSLLRLHYFFPEVVKAMAKWLVFNAVTGRKRPGFGHDWGDYFARVEEAHAQSWSYAEKLEAFDALAHRHFETERFHDFCAEHLEGFDEACLAYFASQGFQVIIEQTVGRHFRDGNTRGERLRHYLGLHRFWLHCERDRLGIPTRAWR